MPPNPILRSHGIGMTRIVLYDKPDTGRKDLDRYVVATFVQGKPAHAGHHQRLDEATRDFENRVALRRNHP